MSLITAAGIVIYRIINGSYEYLLLQASYPPYHWTPPKGHVDQGEDEWTTALRETQEESGILPHQIKVHKDFTETLKYEIVKSRYEKEITMQKTVKYWLARLIDDSSIKLSSEHQNMEWANIDRAIELVVFSDIASLFRKVDNFLKSHSQ